MTVSNSVRYHNAQLAQYRCAIVRMGRHEYDPLAYQYKQDFPDIEITRQDPADLQTLHERCLFTVNGYVHRSVYSDSRLYVPQATPSMLRSRLNATGVLDFGCTGKPLKTLALSAAMITEEPHTAAYDKVIITLPEAVEQPLLVMAGYLITYHPQTFYRVSDNAFAVHLARLQYHEKLYELYRYRDIFRELSVPVSEHNPQMVDTAQVRSLETIKALLSTHNSFMVDLQTPTWQVSKEAVRESHVPGSFLADSHPELPLLTGYGKLAEYASRRENSPRWSVTLHDWQYHNHLLSHRSPYTSAVVNDHRVPGARQRLAPVFFLRMGL